MGKVEFGLSDAQAKAIADMRLKTLNGLKQKYYNNTTKTADKILINQQILVMARLWRLLRCKLLGSDICVTCK